MPATQGNNLGLYSNWDLGESWKAQGDQNWERLDDIAQGSVIDRDLTAPPVSPTDGDRYIVASGGTGDWAGQDDNIAAWHTSTSAWEFYTPKEGWRFWVDDEDLVVVWNSTSWGVFAGGGGGGGFTDYQEDPDTTTGLTWGYLEGKVQNDNAVTITPAGTIALTDNQTNFIEVTGGGVVTANTVGFTTGRVPLYQVTTVAGSQTSSTDLRAPLAVDNVGGGGTAVTDFDEDTGTTIGLTWGFKAGLIRRGNLITSIGAGTTLLPDNQVSFIELDPNAGTVSSNLVGFTAGQIPLRQVTTAAGVQTVSTDQRALFALGNMVTYNEGLIQDLDLGAGGKLKNIREEWSSVSSAAGTLTLDLSTSNNFYVTLTENVTTVTFTNIPSTGFGTPVVIEFTQDGTGGWTVGGWAAGVKWPGGTAPTITSAAGSVDVISGYVRDGTNIRLGLAMGDSQ